MLFSNERTQGANAFNWRLFLGFGYVFDRLFADPLNLVLPLDG
jgi:hypothetical protein